MTSPKTLLVGRDAEVQRLRELLDGGERLVTILGPPGVGKSRLAEHVTASRERDETSVFCELRGTTTPAELVSAVASALGVQLLSGDSADTPRRVEAALASRGRLLLVLDDFDAVAASGASLLQDWLDAAPESRLLVTSRERLGLDLEAVLDLQPLALAHAVEIFVQRAEAIVGSVGGIDAKDRRVHRLVEDLDRLPLALELAAARLRVLSLDQIIERTGGQLRLLRGQGRRSTSLRSAIADSWELLSDAERGGLAACAVFEGEFDLEAAEAVLPHADAVDSADVVDLLAGLRDHSLLQARRDHRLSFRPLRAVREYALEQLPPTQALLRAHAVWCLAAAESASASADGPGHQGGRRLEALRDDVLAAWRWLLPDDPPGAGRLALAMRGVLQTRGPLPELVPLLREPLAAMKGPSELRARLLTALAETRCLLGSPAEALSDAEGAVKEAEAIASPRCVAEARCVLAYALIRLGRREDAAVHLQIVRDVAEPGSRSGVEAWSETGLLHLESGRLDAAAEALDRAEAGFEAMGARRDVARTRFRQAGVAAGRGRFGRARALVEEAQSSFQLLQDSPWEAIATWYLALFAVHRLDDAQARRLAQRAIDLWEQHGRSLDAARGYGMLGVVELLAGRLDEAGEQFARAGAAREAPGRPRHTVRLREAMAILEVRRGRTERALLEVERAEAIAAGALESPVLRAGPLLTRCAVELAAGRSQEAGVALTRATEVLQAHTGALELRLTAALLKAWLDEGPHNTPARDVPLPLRARFVADLMRWINAGRPGLERVEHTRAQATLKVGPQARWFQCAGEERVDLSRRRAMRSILFRLVTSRVQAEGRGLELDELMEAGWPGQRLHPEAGRARVYTSVRSLRRFGLEGVLITRDDGYLLDPSAPLIQMD